jgi:hypothetical protein
MARSWRMGLVLLAVAALGTAGVVWWVNRAGAAIPEHPPASAPGVGTCWKLDKAAATRSLPWPGKPVDCAGDFAVEVFHVGQVDRELVSRARDAKGDERTVAVNLMHAEARRACGVLASRYLGADWHSLRVTLLANWIEPARDGFFACAVAQVADPGGDRLVTRRGTLTREPPQITCVTRDGDKLRFDPCEGPHTGEFVGTYTVTPKDAPFEAKAVASAVTKGCGQATLAYLGLPSDATRPDLHVGYVGPTTAATWLGSDQTFACYASADGVLRGTLRNLGTRPLPR